MAKLYSCDACGDIIGQDKEKVSHLNVMFNYPYEKVGTRHLCKECKIKFIDRIFFNPKKYDLGEVGRYRLNQQFGLEVPVEDTVLTMDDIIQVLNFLIDMRKGERGTDDIDHLGNRRVKTVGELLTNQFNVALSRMLRTIYERMNLRESESITPQDLINSRVVTTVINTFFGTNPINSDPVTLIPLARALSQVLSNTSCKGEILIFVKLYDFSFI